MSTVLREGIWHNMHALKHQEGRRLKNNVVLSLTAIGNPESNMSPCECSLPNGTPTHTGAGNQ